MDFCARGHWMRALLPPTFSASNSIGAGPPLLQPPNMHLRRLCLLRATPSASGSWRNSSGKSLRKQLERARQRASAKRRGRPKRRIWPRLPSVNSRAAKTEPSSCRLDEKVRLQSELKLRNVFLTAYSSLSLCLHLNYIGPSSLWTHAFGYTAARVPM